MAIKSTVYKATLQIADMNRHHYQDHQLTLARHPSETALRMMLRVLAFALYADESLTFSKGLSADDEPELWQINHDQTIELWIELGTPDSKRLKKACSKAKQAVLFCYGDNSVAQWWPSIKTQVSGFDNLTVVTFTDAETEALAEFAERGMQLSVTCQDETVMIANGQHSLELQPQWLKLAQG